MLFKISSSIRMFKSIFFDVILKLIIVLSYELLQSIVNIFYVEIKLFIYYIKSDSFLLQILCFNHRLVKMVFESTLVSQCIKSVS